MCICIYIHVCICVYVYISAYVYAHVRYVCMCVFLYMQMYICAYVGFAETEGSSGKRVKECRKDRIHFEKPMMGKKGDSMVVQIKCHGGIKGDAKT